MMRSGLRAVIKRYANSEEHEVIEAFHGMEAVEPCGDNSSDIIMDIMMPKLDGFSAVKELRKTSDTPVIMLRINAILTRNQKNPFKSIMKMCMLFLKKGLKGDITVYRVSINDIQ